MAPGEKWIFFGRFGSLSGDLGRLVERLIGEEREITIPADDLLTMDVYASESRRGRYNEPVVLEGYEEEPGILTEPN